MKTRTGFVSNSSSASFVLLGFDASNLGLLGWDTIHAIEKKLKFDCLYGDEPGLPEGVDFVVGRFVSKVHSDDGWTESEVIDLDSVMKEVQTFKERLDATTEIKLWKGTMEA